MFAKPRKEERERKASRSFSLFFVVLSTYQKKKKEMDSKELNKEDMKMSRGKRERESERGLFFFPAE